MPIPLFTDREVEMAGEYQARGFLPKVRIERLADGNIAGRLVPVTGDDR